MVNKFKVPDFEIIKVDSSKEIQVEVEFSQISSISHTLTQLRITQSLHDLYTNVIHIQPSEFTWHSANPFIVPSRFFLTTAKFCRRDNFDITLVKVIVTPTNVFTLFQALSRRHSCSLVM